MSAIWGVLRFDGAAVEQRDLTRMGNVIADRGPDGRKANVFGPIGLGHALMRVNHEDYNEAQPLIDLGRNLVLVADARIDNRDELAESFGWAPPDAAEKPDSAFILEAYTKWGEGCPERLLGDFAFALWDGNARRLHLVRDHMGQRAVFYHLNREFLVFASETRALWAYPDVPRVLDEAAFGRHLLRIVDRPPGETLFTGVFGLTGSTIATIDGDGAMTTRSYWQPQASQADLNRSDEHYIETYRKVLSEAVNCRIRRLIHPPALFFSGGFDSAAIAALTGPLLQARNRKLIAVSSIAGEKCLLKGKNAKRAVEWCRRDMPHLDVYYFQRTNETPVDSLERSFLELEMPFLNDYVSRGLFALAKKRGARLVMDGHGGDYTVNVRTRTMLGDILRRNGIRAFAREFLSTLEATKEPFWRIVKSDVLSALLPGWLMDFYASSKRRFEPLWKWRGIAKGFADGMFATGRADKAAQRGAISAFGRADSFRLQVLRLLIRGASSGLSLLAARYGLDLTRPLHDRRVVEFALAIPPRLYYRNGRDRYLVRTALASLLPPEYQTYLSRPNAAFDPDQLGVSAEISQSAVASLAHSSDRKAYERFVDFEALQQMAETPAFKLGKPQFAAFEAIHKVSSLRFWSWCRQSNAQRANDGP